MTKIRQTEYREMKTKNLWISWFLGHGSLWVRVWPYKSCNAYAIFLLKSSFLLPGIDQTNCYCNDDQGMVLQNCIFHDPWGRGSCAKVWPYKSTSNKRPMGHIAHLRNQFESIYQFDQNYDYIYYKIGPVFQEEEIFKFCECAFAIL